LARAVKASSSASLRGDSGADGAGVPGASAISKAASMTIPFGVALTETGWSESIARRASSAFDGATIVDKNSRRSRNGPPRSIVTAEKRGCTLSLIRSQSVPTRSVFSPCSL
jgi:hypothetical protein